VKDAGDDVEQQKTQVQELIDANVSAILINPVDGDAIVPAIEAANEASVPVLTIDRSASGGEIVSHVASDNLAGGRMAAEYLAENLGGGWQGDRVGRHPGHVGGGSARLWIQRGDRDL